MVQFQVQSQVLVPVQVLVLVQVWACIQVQIFIGARVLVQVQVLPWFRIIIVPVLFEELSWSWAWFGCAFGSGSARYGSGSVQVWRFRFRLWFRSVTEVSILVEPFYSSHQWDFSEPVNRLSKHACVPALVWCALLCKMVSCTLPCSWLQARRYVVYIITVAVYLSIEFV